MRHAVVWACIACGCTSSDSVECGDGRTCPVDTVCRELVDPADAICATREQIEACEGKTQLDTCVVDGVMAARCYNGVCLAAGCGNSRLDPDEVCDDGNTNSGDLCSSDCISDETCGNGVPDLVNRETCDDGNHNDNDGCTSTCLLEELRWVEQRLDPPGRYNAAAGYDPLLDRMIMFGGNPGFGRVPDLGNWQFDGGVWLRLGETSPVGTNELSIAFDGASLIAYGGGPTMWRFDGRTWTSVTLPSPAPDKRVSSMLAYDSRRDRVVLVGGYSGSGIADDTWEWDGAAWTQMTTAESPPARVSALLAYDPKRGVIVLAGGLSESGEILTDTWSYDGANWTDVTPASGALPQLVDASIAFDAGSGQLIAYGGCNDVACATPAVAHSTLAWNGSVWTDLALATQPPDRPRTVLVSMGSRIVLYGGFPYGGGAPFGDTWIFENGAWTEQRMPGVRAGAALANDHARDQIVMYGGTDTTGADTSDTWLLSRRGWSKYTGSGPTVYPGAMAYDPIARNVVLFSNSFSALETWVWDGAWTQHTPATSPTELGSLAFDGVHLTLVSGNLTTQTHVETWTWTGNNWVLATPAQAPTMRRSPCVGYDPVRKQLVLFGGSKMFGIHQDETWTYDGTTWTQHDPPVRPPARSGVNLVWNPMRQRLVMIGDPRGAFDTWEWDGTSWHVVGASNLAPDLERISVATAIDGTGAIVYGSHLADGTDRDPVDEHLWQLAWGELVVRERCDGSDHDGDGFRGCADGDCWDVCTPTCPPATSCPAAAPRCGDGVCDPVYETCRTCPGDNCTCAAVCGDFVCDAGETGCPGDCP